MNRPLSGQESRDLKALFFLFGLGVMCLAPRFPDIKSNLGVSTTAFGVLISSGAIGALSAHLTMGHLVHRFGVFKVLMISTVATYLTLAGLVEARNPRIYFIINVICGFSWASYHIAVNAQALHRQAESGTRIIPMLHGLWSAGAVLTAFIALLISSTVSLHWHLLPLLALVSLFSLRSILRLRPFLLAGNEVTEADEIVTFSQMIRSFSIDWVVSLGFLCAVILEMLLGDWATILARQEFGVSKSIAVIPYFLFMGAMILGRFGYARLGNKRSDKELVQPFVTMGGSIFIIGLFLGLSLKDSNLVLGYSIFCISSLVAGFGMSFVGPLFFNYASLRSGKSGGVAVAELGAVNQVLSWVARMVFAVIAGATTLPIAMIMPAVMSILVAFFIAAASQPRDHK